MKWEPAAFSISDPNGLASPVTGEVSGALWGIYKVEDFSLSSGRWSLTHRPSGHSAGFYRQKRDAQKAAVELEKIGIGPETMPIAAGAWDPDLLAKAKAIRHRLGGCVDCECLQEMSA